MAYLYVEIKPGVTKYMQAPNGTNLGEDYCYKLKKSLYRLKQAGRVWNELIDDKLRAQRFIPVDEDNCVYIRRKSNGKITMLLLYADDIICSASSKQILIELVENLRSLFKLKLMGVPSTMSLSVPSQLLGLELIWGRGFSTVQINSSKLVRELLKDQYKGAVNRPKRIPEDPSFKFLKEDCLFDDETFSKEDRDMQKSYRSIAGLYFL